MMAILKAGGSPHGLSAGARLFRMKAVIIGPGVEGAVGKGRRPSEADAETHQGVVMKVSKEQSAANRQALVDAAARLYRERGVAGVGLAEISREAGFTHGGFYGRFDSKEALAAEACAAAMDMGQERLMQALSRHEGDLGELLARYLSPAHRDAPGAGCAMAALGVDAAREGGQLGQAMGDGIAAYLQALALHRPDGTVVEAPQAEDKARAIHLLSAMVGALTLSRACASAAPELSAEILAVTRDVLTAGLAQPTLRPSPGGVSPASAA